MSNSTGHQSRRSIFEQGLEFALLMHFHQQIATSDKVALDVNLQSTSTATHCVGHATPNHSGEPKDVESVINRPTEQALDTDQT